MTLHTVLEVVSGIHLEGHPQHAQLLQSFPPGCPQLGPSQLSVPLMTWLADEQSAAVIAAEHGSRGHEMTAWGHEA